MAINANDQFQERLNLNDRIAIVITRNIGTMACAYLFGVIGIAGVVGALTDNLHLTLLVGSVSGYFLQLVLLPIIIVGQNLQSKHSEIRSEADYQTNVKAEKEIRDVQKKLDAIFSKINPEIDQILKDVERKK